MQGMYYELFIVCDRVGYKRVQRIQGNPRQGWQNTTLVYRYEYLVQEKESARKLWIKWQKLCGENEKVILIAFQNISIF